MFYLIPYEFREFQDFIEKSRSAWITHLWLPNFLKSGRERVLREKVLNVMCFKAEFKEYSG